MSSEKKYLLISVDIADDEEVIHVGAPASVSTMSEHKSASDNSAEYRQSSSRNEAAFAESSVEVPAESGQNKQQNRASGGVSEPVDESIQQTLEDLEAPVPFAKMQKIVLVVLALVVLAFAIYWFTVHGA